MYDIYEIADVLRNIQSNGSKLTKEYLLRENAEMEGFKEILHYIYDPYFTTGIGTKKLDKVWPANNIMMPEEIMKYLKENCTGTDYDASLAAGFVYGYSDNEDVMWLAQAIVTKDLQIGVSVTTLNKVFGKDFIPRVGIMRGMHCPENARGIYIATEKIDGNRRLIMNKPNGPEIHTRSGLRDYGLTEIEEQACELPIGFVYDTECIAVGDYADSIELRQASASILNSKGKRTGVKACAFDMLRQVDYEEGKSSSAAVSRKAMLAGLFGDRASHDIMHQYFMEANKPLVANSINAVFHMFKPVRLPNIMALPILGIAHNKAEAVKLAESIWETGGEGIMLVDYMSAYEVNPNPRSTLLKIKATKEYKLLCTGVYEGDNKYTDMLGGVSIDYRASDGKIYSVDCGSGFPDYKRVQYWNDPSLIIGKMLEIESFGESRNAKGMLSLNCPIFKRIVGEED